MFIRSNPCAFLMAGTCAVSLLLGGTLVAQVPCPGDGKSDREQVAPQQPAGGNSSGPTASATVQAVVSPALKKQEEKKKVEDAKRCVDEALQKVVEATRNLGGYDVGADAKINGHWTPGGLQLFTPTNNFQIHFGARMDFDSVGWRQPR